MKVLRKLLTVMLIVAILLGLLVYRFFFSMSGLPQGELIDSVESPDGSRTLNVYVFRGNATVAEAIRCEVVLSDRIINRRRNIYWQYRQSEASIVWISDQKVSINGMLLDVEKDTYDYRRK